MNYINLGDDINSVFEFKDYGKEPLIINVKRAALANKNFRSTIWTGSYFQVTLMSIPINEEIGYEIHNDTDQLLAIESGYGIVYMGKNREDMKIKRRIMPNSIIIIPAGWWHNLVNSSNMPLKLYSVYSPPQHPKGTVHKTKADSDKAEQMY